MPGSEGNTQLIFLAVATVLVTVMAVRGWYRGLLLQLWGLASIAAAWLAGQQWGPWVGTRLDDWVPIPGRPANLAGGLIVGFGVYLLLGLVGVLVIRPMQRKSRILATTLFRPGGMVLGAAFGLLLVWAAAMLIRVVGTAAEMRVALAESSLAEKPPLVVPKLAHLKRGIFRGEVGDAFDRLDPLPDGTYRILGKLTLLLKEPERFQLFIEHPEVQELLAEPHIVEALQEPELASLFYGRRFFALIQHPRMRDLMKDPAVRQKFREMQLEEALDYALNT